MTRQFGSMAEKVADYEKLLRDLQARASDEDAKTIKATLDRVCRLRSLHKRTIADCYQAALLDREDTQPEMSTGLVGDLEIESEVSGAESEASGGAGSTGALDRTDEDFTREGAKATGFMGKNSDIAWMQRLRHENKYGDSPAVDTDDPEQRRGILGPSLHSQSRAGTNVPYQEADSGFTVHDSSYHLNDLPISVFDAVDPFEMPTPENAHKLFSTYMNRAHPSFPVVGRINLQNQFAKFMARPMSRPPPKWLAIINMIFAIAAKYSHLVQADWRADDRDHMIYFARARLLAIDNETMFNHPDLQMIQIFGLMALYLMCVEQINRAWSMMGTAVRSATALGLNMRNDSSELPNGLKEIRYRVWWALYTLEHRLCTMTGRVTCILDDHCTTPLPVPVVEDDFETDAGKSLLSQERQRGLRAPSSNSPTPPSHDSVSSSRSVSKDDKTASRSPSLPQPQGELEWAKDMNPSSALYFLYLVQLCRITQNIFQQLYTPAVITTTWSAVQTSMHNLNQRIESWYRNLPASLDFARKQRDRDLYEARLSLGFSYYATKQMINRPCLCQLDRKIPGQSMKSHDFNHAAAVACVNAAREQLQLIPDEPNAVGLLRVGPWMNLLHFLVQSATVLMLEVSFRGHHMPEQVDDVLEHAKKAVRWLHAMGDENLAAARAWHLCRQMLADAARKVGQDINDVPAQPPRSYRASSGDTIMPGQGGMYEAGSVQSHDQRQTHDVSQQQAMQPMTTMDMSNFVIPGGFDQLMQYDRYFSGIGDDGSEMQMSQGPGSMNFTNQMPSDLDVDFMGSYINQNPGQNPPSGGGSAGQGSSRYG